MIKLIAFSIASLLTSACLNSPLLDHATANDTVREAQKLSGCTFSFPNAGLCASLEWEKSPTEEDQGSFFLRFWDPKTATEFGPYTQPQDSVFVKLWMPSMGHGSSPVTLVQHVDSQGNPIPGIFHVTNVYFIMKGNWEIWTQLRNTTTVIEQAKTPYTF